MSDFKSLNTAELLSKLNDPEWILIDVRSVDAYNGWPLMGEERGGHIPGARSLTSKWADYIDWIEIVRAKGITKDKSLVVYGYDKGHTLRTAELLQRADYDKVFLYGSLLDEWVKDPSLPLEKLERFHHLVPPCWLASALNLKGGSIRSGNRPESEEHLADDLGGKNLVLCHCHYRNPHDYDNGHIAGAIPLDTLQLESPETWNRRSPAELAETLAGLGITSDTTVVLYGRFSFPRNEDPFPGSAAGHLGAHRCAAIMLYAGVKDVRMLNGGLQSWTDEGYDITNEKTRPKPVADFGAEIPGRPELFIDTPEAKALIESSDGDIVSVRSWSEWTGEISGYNYIEPKGRIPGAIFGNCGSDAYHMENYRNLDHTMREYRETLRTWEEAGITPEKHIAFYCGTGWRGSEAFFNAWLMGWPRVSVYDGGWFEWSADPANPILTGTPDA